MLLNRLRESNLFSILLEWQNLSITEGYHQYSSNPSTSPPPSPIAPSIPEEDTVDDELDDDDDNEASSRYSRRNAGDTSVAFVNAALFHHSSSRSLPGASSEPTLIQFKLRKLFIPVNNNSSNTARSNNGNSLMGVWFIDDVIIAKKELFMNEQ
jgi:hypothetical protein